MAARLLLPLLSLALQARAGHLAELDHQAAIARVRAALALAEAQGSVEYADSRVRAAKKLLLLKIRKDQKYDNSSNANFQEELLRGGEGKQNGNTRKNSKKSKKKKPTRKKKKKKPPNKKKPNKKRGGHPRNKLAFDESCQCGVAPRPQRHGGLWRVVNGEEAALGSHPWAVTLETQDGGYFCGGSIISNRFILTAAHCVPTKGQRVWVHVGDHDKTTGSEATSQRIKGRAKPHPRYNSVTYENDIAIIWLFQDINFTDFGGRVAPVCLARKNARDFADSLVVVAGWGATSEGGSKATVLMEASLRTITNSACSRKPYQYDKSLILPAMLCAVGEGRDACQGDSGGPLVTWDTARERFLQVGVVSWGYGCARPDSPGVYARVSRLERWVLNQAKKIGKFCAE